MPSTDGDGSTYRVVLSAYLATLASVGVVAALVADGQPARIVYPAVVVTWPAVAGLAGAALAVAGTPRWLRPRPLYASGLSWLPGAVGLGVVVGALALLAVGLDGDLPAGLSGAALVGLFGGMAVVAVGWVVRVMARNAEARARFGDADALEWRARPDPRRRRLYYASAAVAGGGLLAAIVWFREPSLVGTLGGAVALAAQGANERHVWLGESTLVYGNPQVRYLLAGDGVAGVRHEGGSLRVERRGWRPALTFDADDIDDPDEVAAALRRLAGTR
ncbi:hypothetical protein [Halorarius halobius]|uniref:hypothetical protein n=1 Tax=Halorarius halobius TaxID=2962671 RepID=UPI0020CC3840|nr:hypothetical protein [Halorarius halobius]